MNWDEYGIAMAKTIASKSKDPSSKVGCYITDASHRPLSQGYNGMVAGADETKLTYERPMKYHCIIHAEMNALIFAERPVRDGIAYITHGPCENCLKHMAQAGIKEIVYDDPGIMRDRGTDEQKKAIEMLINATGIRVRSLGELNYIEELRRV